ncbi:hypothetical protein [Gemmatimonas sp.]|uniref:hypothetical protein n=1 Tax=Gemmatimonas sp. TaxID=1962908 RepID=UPI00286BB03A|nr:hypothetical protein [Gemmatimonas sp.]
MGILVVGSLSACTTWGASTRRPNEALQPVQGKRVGRMLVRLADGREKELWNVQTSADSVVGIQLNKDGTRERVAVARAELNEVTLRQFDGRKTVAWVAGVTIAVVLLAGSLFYFGLRSSYST